MEVFTFVIVKTWFLFSIKVRYVQFHLHFLKPSFILYDDVKCVCN